MIYLEYFILAGIIGMCVYAFVGLTHGIRPKHKKYTWATYSAPLCISTPIKIDKDTGAFRFPAGKSFQLYKKCQARLQPFLRLSATTRKLIKSHIEEVDYDILKHIMAPKTNIYVRTESRK